MARGSQEQRRSKKTKEPAQLHRDPVSYDRAKIVWQLEIVDLVGTWGWRSVAVARDGWDEILPKLKDFETMTWAGIMRASGGRRAGNNHHPVAVEDLSRAAQNRLKELGLNDAGELFSLRLDGTKRIYGIRDRQALKVLWYDPYHGNNRKAVYPVKGR